MLTYLKISHLAIIDEVEVEFREGFNVLTGETGAGKSILIGALNLLLGSRFSPDVVRTGEEEAVVEAVFDVPPGSIPLMESPGDSRELVLSRKIFRAGRSRCTINGNTATVSMLQEIGRSLVSIFGQHEHRLLLAPEEHVEILDRFGRLEDAAGATRSEYDQWKKTEKDLLLAEKRLLELERDKAQDEESSEELTRASLKEGEEDALVQERDILKKAVNIRERAFEAHQSLYSRSGSIIEALADVRKGIDYLASANPKLIGLKENFEDAVFRLEDVALELRDIVENFHSNPQRLEVIEERLALIRRLKKKYGKDLPGLVALLDSLALDADTILKARSAVKTLRARVADKRLDYLKAAAHLSQQRRRAAEHFETSMKKELKDLAMPAAVFLVAFTELPEDKGTAMGREDVEFFLASNPGEDPRPLARIASGGELSRLMLAIKALQVESREGSTVIFDEVDAGIGGHTASAVGTRLSRVAKVQQVLCVTHLHQVAALADHHLSVRKTVDRGRTRILVKALNHEERVNELARMLGAGPESESAKDHVRRLIEAGSVEAAG
ncbi:MAG TPA: DNA repair protein RecN [Desulfomonilaceae bacterium]|nr:DNA repair protein RecN [Desulfomonilaceae bacterium]